MVLQAELSRILADDLHICPTQTSKTLAGHFAEGRREVDEVNAGEESGDVDELGHGLNIETSTATNLGMLVLLLLFLELLGKIVAYINPDSPLALHNLALLLRSVLKLRCG
jgi:hypothetical protein